MKLALGILVVIGVVAYSVAQILRTRREQSDAVSEAWRSEQERKDQITGGQWTGIVKWPWRVDDDAA